MKSRYDITEEGITPMSLPLIFKGDIIITDPIYFSDTPEFDLSVFSKYILFNTNLVSECFVIDRDIEKKEVAVNKEFLDEHLFILGSFNMISQTYGVFYLNEVISLKDIKEENFVVIKGFNGTIRRTSDGLIGNGTTNFYIDVQ